MLFLMCGRMQLCIRASEFVLFWIPLITHVNGMAEALHVSAVWGQGVSEMAVDMGLNTLTSTQPRGVSRYFNGEIHDPFQIQT